MIQEVLYYYLHIMFCMIDLSVCIHYIVLKFEINPHVFFVAKLYRRGKKGRVNFSFKKS